MDEAPPTPTEFVAPTLEELTPLFPAYELEAFIAQGGMGAVYKARQKSLDRDVAIKILPREFGDDPQFRASFEAEAKAMARLNHPNLISVYDFGDIDGMLFIIMEFVQGKALFYSVNNKIISPKVALPLVSSVSRGLAHAHSAGIIHRDIKPANILLDPNATPKIGDFGLARPADLNEGEGLVYGTPGYTAPEIFHRQPVDQRSDIFSVGAMLYQLLSGKTPEANSSQLSTGIDPRVDAIIQKATHPDPQFRHASADELADKLDQLSSTLSAPQVASTTNTPRPTVTSGKSSSGKPAILALAALLIGGGAFAYLFNRDKKVEAPPVASAPATDSKKEQGKKKQKQKLQKENQKQSKKIAKLDKPIKTPPSNPTPPPKPTPQPEPEPEISAPETALASLSNFREALLAGDRSKFPPKSVERNGSRYFLINQKRTWPRASLLAQKHGAQLAVLKTADDLKWAQETFQTEDAIWLGGSDSGMEGKWYWSEGQAIEPSLWTENQPNDSPTNQDGEDFLALSASKSTLEDLGQKTKLPFLIEWKLDSSTPGSLEAQLKRTGAALAAKQAPIFPNGTQNIGGSRFLLVSKSLSWDDASTFAQKAGGHLAVPSNKEEAAYITSLYQNSLAEKNSSWIGAHRSAPGASTWTTVTGERFDFLSWLPGQPNNFNGIQDCLKMDKRENKIGLNDCHTSDIANTVSNVTSFLIEWSHPSMRNMPEEGELLANSDPHAAPLNEIRKKLIDRHGRDYERYYAKKTKIITKFVDDSKKDLEGARAIAGPLVERGIEFLDGIKDEMNLPDELPAAFGKRMGEEFQETQEDINELRSEYEEGFAEARSDYIEALSKAAADATQNGKPDAATYFTSEIALIESNNGRLSKIFRNEALEPPVQNTTNAPVEGDIRSLYIGRWESGGDEDKKVKIILRPNNSANLKSHGEGAGTWELRDGHALININGFKIEVTPIETGLSAKDQEGNQYLLRRIE